VKADGSGGYAWWGGITDTTATDKIKEWSNSPQSLQVSFGSDAYGGETFALIQANGGYCISGNVHDDLKKRLGRIHSRSKSINFIRLFHDGQCVVSDEEGTFWLMHNHHCVKEVKKPGKVEDVAVAEDGSWVVIRENNFVSSTGVDKDLVKKLTKFFSDQRQWGNERRQEIQEAHAAVERERLAQERAVREVREAVERAAREAEEAAARDEIERLRREARATERAERVRIEREAEEAADLNAATRISSLEAKLEKRLIEEANDIKETEANLLRRKRSFHDAMQSMPPETQTRISLGDSQGADTARDNNVCVVCQDEPAVMAVSPCGHVCLCSACSDACMNGRTGSLVCPLCRGGMQSVLRIYLSR